VAKCNETTGGSARPNTVTKDSVVLFGRRMKPVADCFFQRVMSEWRQGEQASLNLVLIPSTLAHYEDAGPRITAMPLTRDRSIFRTAWEPTKALAFHLDSAILITPQLSQKAPIVDFQESLTCSKQRCQVCWRNTFPRKGPIGLFSSLGASTMGLSC